MVFVFYFSCLRERGFGAGVYGVTLRYLINDEKIKWECMCIYIPTLCNIYI